MARRVRYAKRLELSRASARARASLAGVALALRALARATGRAVHPADLVFRADAKPQLAGAAAADFSIAHSGPFVGCAAVCGGAVGFDLEYGAAAHLRSWVAREAVVKAAGLGVRALRDVELTPAGARCRGEQWHGLALALFPGAAACAMTRAPVRAVHVQAVPLVELFAP